jgi:uridine kinase
VKQPIEDRVSARAKVIGFARLVLIPLGPGGDRRYRTGLIHLASDEPIDERPVQAPPDAIVIVDGSFLQRAEVAGLWDHVVFVDTTLKVARTRGAQRDTQLFGGLAQGSRPTWFRH